MPISPAKLAANRRNAQRSTGPKTSDGKLKVSQNARKHGLRSRTLSLKQFFDEHAFFKQVESLNAEMQPRTDEERGLLMIAAARMVQLRAINDLDDQLYKQRSWGQRIYQQEKLVSMAAKLERDLFAAYRHFRILHSRPLPKKNSYQQSQRSIWTANNGPNHNQYQRNKSHCKPMGRTLKTK